MNTPTNPIDGYNHWLQTQSLSERNRRIYTRRVSAFVDFVQSVSGLTELSQCDRLVTLAEHYRDHLLALKGMRPSTINSQLTAVAHFYRYLHGEPVRLQRVEISSAVELKVLSDAQQSRYRTAIAQCPSVRDQALAHLILYNGVRLRECVALNAEDFFPEESLLLINSNSKETMRCLSLNSELYEFLSSWLRERERFLRNAEAALFLSRTGARLGSKSVDFALRRIGISCGLEICARTLRDTFLCQLAQKLPDPEQFASVAGYSQQTFAARYFSVYE